RQLEEHFDRHGITSFGNRLNQQADEFLYRHWFGSFRQFERLIRGAFLVYGRFFHKRDVTRCFDSIHQDKLRDRLLEQLSDQEAIARRIWQRQIARRCWNRVREGCGIFQGHAVSGLLSNVYLAPFDEEMCGKHGLRGQYFRYVDDMVWVHDRGKQFDQFLESIGKSLTAEHGLNFSLEPEKRDQGTCIDYERLSEDQHLQELADCTYEVIRPIYRLGLRESMLF